MSETANSDYYPNCDGNVWLRSCEEEITTPINGVTKGTIPKWLNGNLYRNGPGSIKVGEMNFEHLFDSSALIHRFAIKNGKVTYQCRFLQTDTYKKNKAAKRIVVTEFGTRSVPDPCQTIFHRVASLFKPGESNSDNAMISVYPFGDEFYAFTESPVIHRFDSTTLETTKRLNVSNYIGIVNHTSHPHVMDDGTVYNLGMSVTRWGPVYNIICFPSNDTKTDELMFKEAYKVAAIPVRWPLHPGYMHTFGITDNYYIVVEQPLSVSLAGIVQAKIYDDPFMGCLRWYENEKTCIYCINKNTCKVEFTFYADSFFYLHIINQYEESDHIVLDICCYRDPSILDCMYVEAMKNMQKNPDYAKMFKGRPLRFVLPLNPKQTSTDNMINGNSEDNLVTIPCTTAKAQRLSDGSIHVIPEMLCDLGCETPRLNYPKLLGKKYQFFYAISSDVDAANPGTIIKVDTFNKTFNTWCEDNCYPSEPIFVASPEEKSEDDGVVLSAMVWGRDDTNRVGLLVLDAKTWKEIGRTEFTTPSPAPKCLHGWFSTNS